MTEKIAVLQKTVITVTLLHGPNVQPGDLDLIELANELDDETNSAILASKVTAGPTEEVQDMTPEIVSMLADGNQP